MSECAERVEEEEEKEKEQWMIVLIVNRYRQFVRLIRKRLWMRKWDWDLGSLSGGHVIEICTL